MENRKVILVDQVECIDDSFKPNDISDDNWVKKGELYTPIRLVLSKSQNKYYFVLKEITTNNPLYGGYSVERFSIPSKLIDKLVEEKQYEIMN